MILITGGAGFIGSNIIHAFNSEGFSELLIVDALDNTIKWKNLVNKDFVDYVDKEQLFEIITKIKLEAVIHMGANANTMETDAQKIIADNYEFSKKLWFYCTKQQIKFIYASSAAIYGDGMAGFSENIPLNQMKPLNPYAFSKLLFDRWVSKQQKTPPSWAGLRFFNVYGPGEAHKGSMASVVFHAYQQIQQTGVVKLFKSYRDQYKDGEQIRDFIYVKDVVDVVLHFYNLQTFPSGFYNVGSGAPHTFNQLVETLFSLQKLPAKINYIEMPLELRSKYQYYTVADLQKLQQIGFNHKFHSLHEGISAYLQHLNL